MIRAHGDERIDPYYWLAEKENPEVLAHLEAENAYYQAVTRQSDGGELRERLFQEIKSRIKETDLSVPSRKGGWLYYGRTVEGAQYGIHCRRPVPGDSGGTGASADLDVAWMEEFVSEAGGPGSGLGSGSVGALAGEQIVLDENELAAGHEYFALGGIGISPDQSRAAYLTDVTGAELYELRIRDLQSGSDMALEDGQVESIPGCYYGLAFSADSDYLFYVKPDEAMRPYQIYRHRIGSRAEEDVLVYEEADARFYAGIGKTKDGKYLVISLESKVTSEHWVLPAEEPLGSFSVVAARRQGIEYGVEHWNGTFVVVTNDDAPDFRLVQADPSAPEAANWRPFRPDLLGERPPAGVKLDGLEVFERYLVLAERAEGETRVRIVDPQADRVVELDKSHRPATIGISGTPEMSSTHLRYVETSLIEPRTIFDLDMATGTRRLLKRQEVLGGYEMSNYRTLRTWARAEDGVLVPISLVYRAGLVRDGSNRCLLYGYGSYESSMDPWFSASRLSLLDRGFVFAVAHVRGGGEMGRWWYEDGKLLNKTNTFDDFIAAARHLITNGWTAPERLVARGGSAGGLLMGAVANRAPDLFKAIVAEVPFVDCLTTILDESLPLTVLEWEEWGNPVKDADVYEYMKGYSPYDNVRDGVRYPNFLITAGLNDPRVGYYEPAKWALRLREASPDSQVLVKVELGAGHMGPSGRYDAWRDEAEVLAFIIEQVGS